MENKKPYTDSAMRYDMTNHRYILEVDHVRTALNINLEDVLEAVKATAASKVVLLPLMIVAGDHANNDMAGDEEDSWKTIFTQAGYEVECVLRGMGSYSGVRQMILDHLSDTIK